MNLMEDTLRHFTKSAEMPILPLFIIGTAMLTIVTYFVAIEALVPKPPSARVYLPTGYGVTEQVMVPSGDTVASN